MHHYFICFIFLVLEDSNDGVKVTAYLTVGTILVASIVYFVFDHILLAHKQVEKLIQNGDIFSVLMIDIDFLKK